MRRAYVDVSHFRSPYDSPMLSLTGLGAASWSNWPVGRSYVDVAHFRAPYDQGYFQNNQLFGLGEGEAVGLLGSTLALIGVGVVVGAAGAFIVFQGRKSA